MPGKSKKSAPPHPLAGQPLPSFKLPASGGSVVDSDLLRQGTCVIYFYPRADTPGCTVQACVFSEAISQYKKLKVPVYAISPDPIKAVQKFADKFSLKFPLVADEDHSVTEKFGCWVEKSMYGKKYWGAARTTFVVQNGKIVKVFEKVKPEGHDQEVLKYLENMDYEA